MHRYFSDHSVGDLAIPVSLSTLNGRVVRSWNVVVLLVVHAFQQGKFKHVAECQYASELCVLVDDDEAVDS